MRKVLVQFDGSNFYNKVKRVMPKTHLTYFNYFGLAQYLAGQKTCETNYYVGEIKQFPGNQKSQFLYKNQQTLFQHLREQSINVKTGYLLQSNGIYHEKGVDVRMAVDMAVGAVKSQYDTCYLLSSDTDLIPAIETAQAEGKEVVYVGFKESVSQGMKKNCSSYVTLSTTDLEKFVN